MKPARLRMPASAWANGRTFFPGTSRYATGSPCAFRTPWLTIFQWRAASGSTHCCASVSRRSGVTLGDECVAVGVLRARGRRLGMRFTDGIGHAVDAHVQPHVKEVLVIGRDELRGD